MRIDSSNFRAVNNIDEKSPRFTIAIAFDAAETDIVYLTSHSDSEVPPAATVITGIIQNLSSTSQSINHDKGIATIGSMSFDFIDLNSQLTTLIKTKLDNSKGLYRKMLRVYVGGEDYYDVGSQSTISLTWSDYVNVVSQLIVDITYKDGVYSFKTNDIQRETKKEIFNTKKCYLGASVDFTATDISTEKSSTQPYIYKYKSTSTNFLTSNVSVGKSLTVSGFSNSANNGESIVKSVTANEIIVENIELATQASGNTVSFKSGTLGVNDTTVHVNDTSGFQTVYQSVDNIGYIGQEVGFIKIDKEIILYTGKTATTFTGCIRGMLSSTSTSHDSDLTKEVTKRKKVDEHIYLEGNAVYLMYAILTGKFYGTAYELPSHWSLNIDESFVASNDFVNIGLDYFDSTSVTSGIIFTFEELEKTDGKLFLEKEFAQPLNLFFPIYGNGELGLKKFTKILTNSASVVELNEDSILEYGDLQYDLSAVKNTLVINWNYSIVAEDFRIKTVYSETDSVTAYGLSEFQEYDFKGISSSLISDEVIDNIILSLRDRICYPPLHLNVTLPSKFNVLEVGDVVKVKLPQIRDPSAGSTIDRSFEIENISIDWTSGKVNIQLYSTTVSSPLVTLGTSSTIISDGWYGSQGTNISTVLTTTSSGGTTSITSNGHLPGNSNGELAIYYCQENLTINAGVSVTYDKNVRLYVKGNIQINGNLNSIGSGLAVGQGSTSYSSSRCNATVGAAGYFGDTSSQNGTAIINSAGVYTSADLLNSGQSRGFNGGLLTKGQTTQMEKFNVIWDGSTLSGLPKNLVGSSGCGGGSLVTNGPTYLQNGGNGGQGGAGLVIVSRGLTFGAIGYIDTSGEPGVSGILGSAGTFNAYSGAGGGGAPGAFLLIIDGNSISTPTLTFNDTYFSKYGSTPVQGTPNTSINTYPQTQDYYSAYHVGTFNDTSNKDNYYILRLGKTSTVGEVQETVDDGQAPDDVDYIILTSNVNSLNSTSARFTSITVTVDPPADSNYSHAFIYFRELGKNGWIPSGIANDEWVITPLPADGTTYEVQARSVSHSDIEALSGLTSTVTVLNLEVDDLSQHPELTMPDVSGLEIHGQGNDNEFTGRECWIEWRRVNLQGVEFGDEPLSQGADAGAEGVTFDYYLVEIYDNSLNLLREEKTKDNWFIYTWEKNREDYLRLNAAVGANRQFTFKIKAVSKLNQRSPNYAQLSVINPAPTITAISTVEMFKGCSVDFTIDDDADYAYTEIHLSTSNGFTPGVGTLVAELSGRTDFFTVTKDASGAELLSNTTYYVKIIPFDLFGGQGVTSTQQTFTTVQLDGDVDIQDVTIGNAKIYSLAVDKLTTGTLTANVTQTSLLNISTGGKIYSGTSTYNSGTGYVLEYNAGNPRMFIGNSAGSKLLWTGSALEITGDITSSTITSGLFQTATSGQRIIINESSSNEIRFYGDRGDATIENLIKIGVNSQSGYNSLIIGGSANNSRTVFNALSTGVAAYMKSTGGHGLYTTTSSAGSYGLYATNTNAGVAIVGEGYSSGTGLVATSYDGSLNVNSRAYLGTSTTPLTLSAASSASAPSHSASKGSFWVPSGGDLYYNASGSTTWTKINSVGIGSGQTWQDVSGSRSSGAGYTNTTSLPIMVSVTDYDSSGNSSGNVKLTIDGVLVAWSVPGVVYTRANVSGIVPVGSTYVVNYTSTATWAELR